MSQTIGQPGPPPGMMPPGGPGMGQAPQGVPPAVAPPGMAGPPAGPVGVPPGATPNPAFAQWMKAFQEQQGIVQENAKRTAQFQAATQLIRSDGTRGFKLDIEADSTVAPDEQAEKQARVEFIQQITPFLQQGVPLAQGNPDMAALFGEMAMFAIRAFRVARPLEEAFEKAFKVIGTMPPVPPKGGGKQENPELEKARIDADVHDTTTQAQSAQAVAASKAQTDQLAIAQKAQQANQQLQTAQMREQSQQQNDATEAAIELAKLQSAERIAAMRSMQSSVRSGE